MSRDPHVVSALKEKPSRLKGERDKVHFRMVALRIEIANVETCLKMFAEDIDPATIPAKITFEEALPIFPKTHTRALPWTYSARLGSRCPLRNLPLASCSVGTGRYRPGPSTWL